MKYDSKINIQDYPPKSLLIPRPVTMRNDPLRIPDVTPSRDQSDVVELLFMVWKYFKYYGLLSIQRRLSDLFGKSDRQ